MNFVSFDFLYFLALVFTTYFLLPNRWRNTLLLAASYFFYGYWSIKYLLLLIATMLFDYALALGIAAAKTPRLRRSLLTCSIGANLGVLAIFKYFNLFSDGLSAILGYRFLTVQLILPFGISFYTFHAMSYTIDVYRRVIPAERNFTYYSGYVMFFPQLVAGPIARAHHLLPQFKRQTYLTVENLTQGAWLIARGFFMKLVLADTLAGFVNLQFGPDAARVSPFLTAQAVYFFAFQIYCDFAGYTDIARGVAKLFDFDLVVNFDRPYVASSITDFWRRWHISLSTWLRDYLYISLGGNRRGRWKTYRNLMITMLLGGLWHGANWTFMVWGGLHGLYLATERLLKETALGGPLGRVPKVVRQLVTFHLVCLGWIFFRSASFAQASEVLVSSWSWLAHPWRFARPELQVKLWLLVATWMTFEWAEARWELFERYRQSHWLMRYAVLYAACVAIVLFAQLNPMAFVYFQF